MARRKMLTSIAIAGALLLSGCGSTEKYRYKMTVEVETPDGLKTGSAVREIVIRTPPSIPLPGEHKPGFGVIGEAVAIDIAPGKTLFALLSGADGTSEFSGRYIHFIFQELAPGKKNATIELWPNKPVTRRPIISEPTPMLVTFRDSNDPASIRKIEPSTLDADFGPTTRLKRIYIAITNEPVTNGIEKRLAWLPEYYGKQLSGDRFQSIENVDKGISAFVSSGAFSANMGLRPRGEK